MVSNPFWAYWYFHLPNYVLALGMYLVVGRLLLTPFASGSQNYIWRSFVRMTDPVVALVGAVTPQAVPLVARLAFAFLWLLVARLALFIGLASAGLAPGAGV